MAKVSDSSNGFWRTFLFEYKSMGTLLLVCAGIAVLTSWLNHLGYWVNFMASLSYGLPIYTSEVFLRTRTAPWSDMKISLTSIAIGIIVGSITVYQHLVTHGIVEYGEVNKTLVFNFSFGIVISVVAFYFFWSRYHNQTLTLALRNQQLQAAKLENLKRQAENRLLQSQIQPHFLFNTLANIQSLVDIDPAIAKRMLADLSHMLRAVLKNSEQDLCSLEQELILVRAYLGIQKIRMGERLSIEENIDTTQLPLNCIPMILQPLVENSIRHAVEPYIGDATIKIEIYQDKYRLVMVVTDDCPPNQKNQAGHGLSLQNIRQRLENVYGQDATFSSSATSGGWRNEIKIPLAKMEGKS